jgi:hypothetical protein
MKERFWIVSAMVLLKGSWEAQASQEYLIRYICFIAPIDCRMAGHHSDLLDSQVTGMAAQDG